MRKVRGRGVGLVRSALERYPRERDLESLEILDCSSINRLKGSVATLERNRIVDISHVTI